MSDLERDEETADPVHFMPDLGGRSLAACGKVIYDGVMDWQEVTCLRCLQLHVVRLEALVRRLAEALDILHDIAGGSVELSDWPELQAALEQARAALAAIPEPLRPEPGEEAP